MKRLNKQAIVAVMLFMGMLTISGWSFAQNGPKGSAPVTIVDPLPLPVILDTTSSVSTVPAVPVGAFTIPPAQVFLVFSGSPAVAPDPSGTQYAITSVVLSNNTDNTGEIELKALAYSFTTATCQSPANQTAISDGPKLTVGAHSTATLTFPVPFVTAPVSGPQVCLVAGSNSINFAGVTWSAVGYRLPAK